MFIKDFELFDELGAELDLSEDITPDELLSELFGEGHFHGASTYPESTFRISNELSPEMQEAFEYLGNVFERDTKGLTREDAESYMENGVLSFLGSVAKRLIPVAVSGIGKALNQRRKKRVAKRFEQRKAQALSPQQQTRPAATPPPNTTNTAPVPAQNQGTNQAANAAISALVNLLSNPNVVNALSNLARGGESRPIYLGEMELPVYEGSLLNAISEYAQMAKMEINDSPKADALDYLKAENGEFMVDVGSSVERAERLVDLLTETIPNNL